MVDWLAANLRDRAAYDAICEADRAGPTHVRLGWKVFDDERDETINRAAFSAWHSTLKLAIDLARKADRPLDRVAIQTLIHERVGNAIVSSLADFGLLDMVAFVTEPCLACGRPECDSAFCEPKRRKAEQQAKAQAWAARDGVTGDAR